MKTAVSICISRLSLPKRLQLSRSGRGASAFTLVELLVTIAVIAILAGLLLPVLSRAKQRAQGAYCMNNGHQMMAALHLYAADFNDWLPPNQEDNNPNAWVRGSMIIPTDATNTLYLTDPKWAKLAPYTGPSPSLYKCPADKSTTTINGSKYPRVRTFSMSQSVGTKSDPPLAAVDGPWLDGTRDHKADHPWRTYGRFVDMVTPAPSGLWVFTDEDEHSLNDAAFAVSMTTQPTEWKDWPGTYHNFACGIAFADGHSEIHKWTDGRTGAHDFMKKLQPNNRDIFWLQQRTSAKVSTEGP